MDVVELPQGTDVVREGERADEFYVLLSGAAEVERAGARLRSLRPGDVFGELALVTYTRRTATVRTTEPSHLLVLSEHEFRTLVATNRSFSRRVFADAARRSL